MKIDQVVQVEILGAFRPYTYSWSFDPFTEQPLAVGDKVELPPNQVQEEGSSGTVVRLGSDYNGPMKSIVRVIERSNEKNWAEPGASADDLWEGFGEGDFA